jgi:hypothetical protein
MSVEIEEKIEGYVNDAYEFLKIISPVIHHNTKRKTVNFIVPLNIAERPDDEKRVDKSMIKTVEIQYNR